MYKLPEGRTGRSVNDFLSPDGLKAALNSMERQPSVQKLNAAFDPAPRSQPRAKRKAIDDIGSQLVRIDKDIDWVVSNYDRDNSETPTTEKEMRRLAVLKSYRVVGSGRDAGYERLISLATRIFKVPMALISVIDLSRQYFLATRGLGGATDFPRKHSICAHCIISKLDLLIVPDLSKDCRFENDDQVTGDAHLRFYASAPLMCPEGYRLGTFCLLDTKPRPEGLSLAEKQNLRELAGMVMDVMVEYREQKNHEFRHPTQLIASTSNDLMTPLLGVMKGLSTLRDDQGLFESLSTQQKEMIVTAGTCSAVLGKICKRSMDIFYKSKPNRGRVVERRNKTNGQDVLKIKDLVTQLHMVMEPFPKQVPLVITTDPAVPPAVVADDLKIFRSVVNYLTNACGKTERGSVHLKISVRDNEEMDDTAYPQSLVFSVEDSGPGISIEHYSTLFKPVVRSDDYVDPECGISMLQGTPTAPEEAGDGLGLYSVATHMRSLGGRFGYRPRCFAEDGTQRVDPEGRPLRGSIFWLSVPLILPEEEAILEEVKEENAVEASTETETGDDQMGGTDLETMLGPVTSSDENAVTALRKKMEETTVEDSSTKRKKRVLLIEDSQVCRKVMSKDLESLGFDVVEAKNGMEGLTEMQASLFDLILCDFLMPVLDGLDCVQQYREFEVTHRPWFDQFIMGMSAHASSEDVKRGLEVGMNDYKAKPLTLEVLKGIVDSPQFQFVTTRLDAVNVEVGNGDASATGESQEMDSEPALTQPEHCLRVCLLAEGGDASSAFIENYARERGWKFIVVKDGESALRLLQMRNWDAVLMDDELPGMTSCRCILHFREWEQQHRVHRQKNVLQMSSSFIPSHIETSSSVQLPSGFDGALGKPLSRKAFESFLDQVGRGTPCQSIDIVRR